MYWGAKKNRTMVVGKSEAGRPIAIVLADKAEGNFYPVTARAASRKERRRYVELKGGEQAA